MSGTRPGPLSRLLDAALDATVVLSFDRNGFRRHARHFDPADLEVDLSGRTAMVTGANSGIGKATAAGLARLGAHVVMLCRDEGRGRAARGELEGETGRRAFDVVRLDVSDLGDVRRVGASLARGPIDVLVHNAGVLPDRRESTPDGLELTLATNLAGPFLLTGLLLPALARAKGRVVQVSSGGMYTQRLDVAALFSGGPDPFDGVVQYARTKRAQVVLNGLLAEKLGASGVVFSAMHPGWADTPAVRTSLPRFHALTKGILRTPEEGADTVIWLAASRAVEGRSGLFWFDRDAAEATPLPGTRESAEERGRLWEALVAATGLDPAAPTAPRGSAPGRRRRTPGS